MAEKPVVCFADAGGATELIEEDAGFIVPYFDLQIMTDKIIELIQNPSLRAQFGQRGKQKVLEKHQTEPSVQHIIDTINQLM